jgi:hypothetical protein
MKKLCIEWKHLDTNKSTCIRCSKTGKTLKQVVADLKKELNSKEIKINFTETKLSKIQIQIAIVFFSTGFLYRVVY